MLKVDPKYIVLYYLIAGVAGYFLKRGINKISDRAIRERKLSTGIYRFIKVEGDEAIKLAKGYKSAFNLMFWFIILIFPLFAFVIIPYFIMS